MAHASTTHASPGDGLVGRSVPRLEDVPLLTGKGRFVDDIVRPQMLHAFMFRSNIEIGRASCRESTGHY